jgi:hypothetical protein
MPPFRSSALRGIILPDIGCRTRGELQKSVTLRGAGVRADGVRNRSIAYMSFQYRSRAVDCMFSVAHKLAVNLRN